MAKAPMNICLASTSPRRLQLLQALGHHVLVREPVVQEISMGDYQQAFLLALHNARLKVEYVMKNYTLSNADFMLSADTIVVCEQEILGKPKDLAQAFLMLSRLSGKTHEVITSFCLSTGEKIRENYVISTVKFKKLSPEEINAYLHLGESLDKAGAYAIQNAGAALIESIKGSLTNIIGLPITEVLYEARLLLARS